MPQKRDDGFSKLKIQSVYGMNYANFTEAWEKPTHADVGRCSVKEVRSHDIGFSSICKAKKI
jgi:hypothetical protein